MRLTYHPDATAEFLEAVRNYEARVTGLGERFRREFSAAVMAIQDGPERWQAVERDVRRYVMRRFPYGIYYRVLSEEVFILVVKHHSRHPDYWKYRLRE